MAKLEIAVTSLEDALQAEAGGADSVEICRDLSAGGLTPPLELVQRICGSVALKVNVIVRPHSRSFIYSKDEVAEILQSVGALSGSGADGIVFGAWNDDGRLNMELIGEVCLAAGRTQVTVHRALDRSLDPEGALETLAATRVSRILTAGPADTAWDGRFALAGWIQKYRQHFNFVVSGGLRPEQLPEMISLLNAAEYHFGAAARTGDSVDAGQVRQLRSAIPAS